MSIRGGFDKSSSPPLLAPMDLGRLFRFGTGHWVEGDPRYSSHIPPFAHIISILSCFPSRSLFQFFFFTIFFQRNRKSFQRIGHQNGLAYNVSLNFLFSRFFFARGSAIFTASSFYTIHDQTSFPSFPAFSREENLVDLFFARGFLSSRIRPIKVVGDVTISFGIEGFRERVFSRSRGIR